MKILKNYQLFLLLFLSSALNASEPKPHVIGNILGQTGNIFFQVATASALAWDNDADPYFPELAIVPSLYHHYFSRCKITPPSNKISYTWSEPKSSYIPIPYEQNMSLSGYFQSWKYFDHYKDRLVTLFSPLKKDMQHIEKKYGHLLKSPITVGIQIRYYGEEAPSFAQFGRDYFEKAMKLFPDESLFIVSSNNMDFAKSQLPLEGRNIVFLEGEPPYIDFHLLTRCTHNIISNSTFGWWMAYLNLNPHKIIVCPAYWIAGKHINPNPYPYPDIYPDSWIQIEADTIN